MQGDKLRGKITEIYGHQTHFAKALGVSDSTLSQKLTNKRNMKRDEIERWCELLKIQKEEIPAYFFTD